MRQISNRPGLAVCVLLAVLCCDGTFVRAQSGTYQGSSTETPSRQRTRRSSGSRSFEARLWSFLTQQKYQNWAPVPGRSGDAYAGQSPHGAFLKMYLNRTAAGNPRQLPSGSIIIKENYGSDGETLAAITVMYRSSGYNPEGGDWYWVKYNPDGSVARAPRDKGGARLAGKPRGCLECHQSADGDDYAFFNDP